jgi:propionyl-CoA carboxylase alpha chain/3-methylcrotonyl-CoA carboxylase alpha subunit/acetyl-CoA/propionyl-CoA carboxylase biotin carboxyl carrier protein
LPLNEAGSRTVAMVNSGPIKKVLIANRGEIAWRVLRCLQSAGIGSVAIYTSGDRNSPVVRQADEAVEVFGSSPSAAHLDIEQILAICKRLGVDAVHPGYGFLAENAEFARALEAARIHFIGPTSEVIELMGDKIAARHFVKSRGYPVPPSVTLDIDAPGFMAAASTLGFPLVVKAAAGGGGKGMSIARDHLELQSALRLAASEAAKYFGDNRVYVERYFRSARHIEVQVLGDGADAIHLGERECSIQRRFQKLIEEAPSPALTSEKRHAICETAVEIARAARYGSAGTVEFLYTSEGEFFFLEMNTRIQVEHPVTELVYGIDLVAEQLRIAAGQPLGLRQQDVRMNGHAIECRICAEEAFQGFLPETGKVLFLKEPAGAGIRFDSGLYLGQDITTSFDPMLAKLLVHAPTRVEAIAGLIRALKEFVLLGVTTNIAHLIKIFEHPAFVAGDFDTGFVTTYAADLIPTESTVDQLQVALIAGLLTDRDTRSYMDATPEPYAAIGHWRN